MDKSQKNKVGGKSWENNVKLIKKYGRIELMNGGYKKWRARRIIKVDDWKS